MLTHFRIATHCITLFIAAALLPLPAMASHMPFAGFNVSAGIGLTAPSTTVDGELHVIVPTILQTVFEVSRKGIHTDICGGVRLGYNLVYKQNYLFGLAGDANFGSNQLKFDALVNEINSSFNIMVHTPIRLENQYALLVKLGRLLGSRALIYGLVGPQWGSFLAHVDISYSQNLGALYNAEASARKSQRKTGILAGLGLEMLLNRCTSISLEYAHTYYGSISQMSSNLLAENGISVPNSELVFSNKNSIRVHNLMLRLGYYF